MSLFRVSSFEKREDLFAGSSNELTDLLCRLSAHFRGDPVLVNIYDGDDRIAIVGLGAAMSTLQCVDKQRRTSVRVLSDFAQGDDAEFNYQGEATYVPAQYLIPEGDAIGGAVAWISDDQLISGLKWRMRPFPNADA